MEDRAVSILTALETEYPNVRCGLNFNTPFQLLVATMLSAQSTDKTVNRITEGLFYRYPSLKEFLGLSQEELMEEIKEIGLYRNKSKNILEMCNDLIVKFGGEVPSTMEDLVSLPGVGRKTANVVLSNAFGIPAIAVDTHVFRVSNRIGLAESKNVEGTEEQLMKNIPKEKWSLAHHLLIWHGRLTCMARKPQCDRCCVSEYCKFYKDQHN
ncbi:MAG TPA: endonuclease III [Clostridia bacterium]